MSLLKYDGPVMSFISLVTDMFLLNLICAICCIPVVTVGAAYTAKYTIAMKIVRGEATDVFKPYFKAFKANFKQATLIWLIQLLIIGVLAADWLYIFNSLTWAETPMLYKVGIIALSLIVLFINMSVYPLIARFDMTIKEALKGALIFAFLHFIKLLLIAALLVGMVVACIWYYQWVPVLILFCTTTALYYNCHLCVKEFKKMEENLNK